jgi:DNA ligase-1
MIEMVQFRNRKQKTEPALCTLAQRYRGQDVTGWLVSEKLDGLRGIWNGHELLSRNGNRFFAPDWFIVQLPPGVPLDGELWAGRGQFNRALSIVTKHTPVDSEWREIRFCVFDAPAVPGGFKQRIAFATDVLIGNKVARVVPQFGFGSKREMLDFFLSVGTSGGEGVMLRNPSARYEYRRTENLLKLKVFKMTHE